MKIDTKLLVSCTIFIVTIALPPFYWFQYRPSRIKHDCSWVKEITNYQPARPAMTEKQIREYGWGGCQRTKSANSALEYMCEETIRSYKRETPEIKASEHWRESSDMEYRFCLRDKGL